MRVTGHPVLPDLLVDEITFSFNGRKYAARVGEPVAAALLAEGVRCLRFSPVLREPRGVYCGIGHCYECCVWMNDDIQVRACITPVTEGAAYSSERGQV